MGPRPGSLHGREVGPAAFRRCGGGPSQQFDIWVLSKRRRGWRSKPGGGRVERRTQKKDDRWRGQETE